MKNTRIEEPPSLNGGPIQPTVTAIERAARTARAERETPRSGSVVLPGRVRPKTPPAKHPRARPPRTRAGK